MRGHTDLLIDRARELLGLDESWGWCGLEVVPPGGKATAFKVTLAQKKGERFVKPCQSIHLSVQEEAANADQWSQRSGKCSACVGKGQEIARISVADGTTWRPCRRCQGSGRDVSAVPALAGEKTNG